MHRSEQLGLSKIVDVQMSEEWYNGIVSDIQPAIDLINEHLNSGYENPGGEYFNLSWPMGHTPYTSSEQKRERTEQGLYEEVEFDNYDLNCNYFRKGTDEEYIVHGILTKKPNYEVGKYVQKLIDTISEKEKLQDKYIVMLVMYKGPNFCMQWHQDLYTHHRFQLPITTTPEGQFGWQYKHEDGNVEEVWLSMEKAVLYKVNTQNIHIFDNSRPGCTGRIFFMVDFLDWKPFYQNGYCP